jgi:hypothetical protein
MSSNNPRLLVHALKGSRAQVLLAFIFARCALDVKEIRKWTGLGRDTIYDALTGLESMGLLGKQILAHDRSLWLPAGDMIPGFSSDLQMSENPTSELPATTTKTINPLITNTVVVVESQMSENPTSTEYLDLEVTFEKNFEACKQAGIGDPKATEISNLAHVSPGFIQAHKQSLMKGETLGLAIIRIINNECPRLGQDTEEPITQDRRAMAARILQDVNRR